MRCMKINKQKMYYSLLIGTVPEYELDEFGNKKIAYEKGDKIIYAKTGVTISLYSPAIPFEGNIAMSGSDVSRQEFGISDERYEAVLVLNKDEIPIDETSLIWYQTEPTTKEIEGQTYADDSTADYRVLRVIPSINNDRYILAKVVK